MAGVATHLSVSELEQEYRAAKEATAAMLCWALMASRRITMRPIDDWQPLNQTATNLPLDLAE